VFPEKIFEQDSQTHFQIQKVVRKAFHKVTEGLESGFGGIFFFAQIKKKRKQEALYV
jgi:hypothetical protein